MAPKQMAELENWTYLGGVLYGQVYGHPARKDGEEIRSSTVLSPPDMVKEGNEVETKNTVYLLCKEYKEKK